MKSDQLCLLSESLRPYALIKLKFLSYSYTTKKEKVCLLDILCLPFFPFMYSPSKSDEKVIEILVLKQILIYFDLPTESSKIVYAFPRK